MTKLALLCSVLVACAKDDASNAEEVITTVILDFTPAAGGALSFEADDPDGNGGNPPVIDPVSLPAGAYTLAVRFQNRLEDPPEEITDEVRDESDQHLVLFTGTAVVGPATTNTTGPLTQSYTDTDINGLPVGLSNDITAAAGTGSLTLTLRHMPPEEPPQKAADTLTLARDSGIESLGGGTDAQVVFAVTVTP